MHLKSLLLSLAAVSAAAPAANFLDHAYDFPNELGDLYSKVSQHIDRLSHGGGLGRCDTSKIKLPWQASTAEGLASPDGLTPMHVALGRGTQNYTCADSTSDSKPKAIGAVASLYNATCVAANYPKFLEMIPGWVHNISLPILEKAIFPPAKIDLMGHHFFEATTPEFNFNLPSKNFGVMMTKKEGEMKAPASSTQGENGAVAWLLLTSTTGTVGRFKSVYRVDTAAGSPPDTCENMPASFEVQYAANYFFFGN